MSDTKKTGRFVWFDLMTTDPDAAVKFYTDAMDWGTALFEGGDPPYTMWTAGETRFPGTSWPVVTVRPWSMTFTPERKGSQQPVAGS